MQGLRIACKHAQAGKDQAESRCAELDLELETLKAAATALRQVRPLYLPYVPCQDSAGHSAWLKPLTKTLHPVIKEQCYTWHLTKPFACKQFCMDPHRRLNYHTTIA